MFNYLIPKIHCRVVLFILLTLLTTPLAVFAESSASLINKGNSAYYSGQYDEALEAYEKASVDEPESPYIYFNKGTAEYMKGDFEKAGELFEKAALKSKDLTLEARSLFNMGNSSFRESERQRDSDLKKSLKGLEQAILNYQKALKLDPKLKSAAKNIEIARLTFKQIMDEIKKKEEEEKQKREEKQKMAEKLKELIAREEKLTEETKSLEQGRGGQKDQSDELARKQEAIKSETAQLSDKIDQQQQKSEDPGAKVKEHLQRSLSEQDTATKELQNEKLSNARTSQERATDEMKKALEAMKGEDQDGQQNQKEQNQQGEEKQDQKDEEQNQQGEQEKKDKQQEGEQGKPAEKSDKEVDKDKPEQEAVQVDEDAHDILNEERENREMREIPSRGGYRSTDKDW